MADIGSNGAWGALATGGNSLINSMIQAKQNQLAQQEAQAKIGLENAQAGAVKPQFISGSIAKQLGYGGKDLPDEAQIPISVLSPFLHLQGTQGTNQSKEKIVGEQLGAKESGKGGFANKYSGGGTGSGTPSLSPKSQELLGNITSALSQVKGAYDYARQNNLFPENPGLLSGLGSTLAEKSGLANLVPAVSNEMGPAKTYFNRAENAGANLAKVISGGRPNEFLMKTLMGHFSNTGTALSKAQEQESALYDPELGRTQGLLNQVPENEREAFGRELQATFGRFSPGQEGGGVRTNVQGQGLNPPATGQPQATPQLNPASVHPPDIIEKAKAALADPNAPAEVKAKAQSLLGTP